MLKRLIVLSFIVVSGFISIISVDILNIQNQYSIIENTSNIVSNEISIYGGISNSVRQYVKKEINAEIYCALDDCSHVKSGDTYIYVIKKDISPILISFKPISINIKKSVVIK